MNLAQYLFIFISPESKSYQNQNYATKIID